MSLATCTPDGILILGWNRSTALNSDELMVQQYTIDRQQFSISSYHLRPLRVHI